MLIHGQCHCGNIGFSLSWESDPETIPARACDCSFCMQHGGVWTSHPDAHLQIRVTDKDRLSRYAFGTRTAEFLICANCGVVPVAISRIDGTLHAVVNVNTFTNVSPAMVRRTSVHLGDETAEVRLGRRQERWIGHVELVEESN